MPSVKEIEDCRCYSSSEHGERADDEYDEPLRVADQNDFGGLELGFGARGEIVVKTVPVHDLRGSDQVSGNRVGCDAYSPKGI